VLRYLGAQLEEEDLPADVLADLDCSLEGRLEAIAHCPRLLEERGKGLQETEDYVVAFADWYK